MPFLKIINKFIRDSQTKNLKISYNILNKTCIYKI